MGERLIVDGYNVVHAWPETAALLAVSLEAARDRLVERLAILAAIGGPEVTVVFDAHRTAARRSTSEVRDGVEVVFTRRGHSADHAIERLAFAARDRGQPLRVATNDGFHREMLRGMGAAVIGCAELLREVEAAEAEMALRLRAYRRPG